MYLTAGEPKLTLVVLKQPEDLSPMHTPGLKPFTKSSVSKKNSHITLNTLSSSYIHTSISSKGFLLLRIEMISSFLSTNPKLLILDYSLLYKLVKREILPRHLTAINTQKRTADHHVVSVSVNNQCLALRFSFLIMFL